MGSWYTFRDIYRISGLGVKAIVELDDGPYWPDMTESERNAHYNGMGAAWMPDFSRDILGFLFKILDPAVRRHDVGFAKGKTIEDYYRENKMMRDNMLILVDRLPWYRWHKKRRFRVYWIPLLYAAVESSRGEAAFWAGKDSLIIK